MVMVIKVKKITSIVILIIVVITYAGFRKVLVINGTRPLLSDPNVTIIANNVLVDYVLIPLIIKFTFVSMHLATGQHNRLTQYLLR